MKYQLYPKWHSGLKGETPEKQDQKSIDLALEINKKTKTKRKKYTEEKDKRKKDIRKKENKR